MTRPHFAAMSVVAILSLLIGVVPVFMGAAYAIRPSEAKLALMRPLSLASLFGAFCGLLSGAINMLTYAGREGIPTTGVPLLGMAEALLPLDVAFASLTIAWLFVALGMRRRT